MNLLNKKEKGQYFTIYNPFDNEGFKEWSQQCDLTHQTILEPFGGCNNLIKMLQEMSICKTYKSYDIEPQDYFEYVRTDGNLFAMSFEGPLNHVLNYYIDGYDDPYTGNCTWFLAAYR